MISIALCILSPSVTFDAPAGRVSALLPAVGAAMGTALRADPSVADDIVLISVKDKNTDEVLAAIAEATGAEWRMDADGRTLVRSSDRAKAEILAAKKEMVAAVRNGFELWKSSQNFEPWDAGRSQRYVRLIQQRQNRVEGARLPDVPLDWGPFAQLIVDAFDSLSDEALSDLALMSNVEVSHQPKRLQYKLKPGSVTVAQLSANINLLSQAQQQMGMDEPEGLLGRYSSFTLPSAPLARVAVAFSFAPSEMYVQIVGFDAKGFVVMDGMESIGTIKLPNVEAPFVDGIAESEADPDSPPPPPSFEQIHATMVGPPLKQASRKKNMDVIAALSDSIAAYIAYSGTQDDSLMLSMEGEMKWKTVNGIAIGMPSSFNLAADGRGNVSERVVDRANASVSTGRDQFGALGALWSETGFWSTYCVEGTEVDKWMELGGVQPIAHRIYGFLQTSQRVSPNGTTFASLSPGAKSTIRAAWDLGMFDEAPSMHPNSDTANLSDEPQWTFSTFAEDSPEGFGSTGRVYVQEQHDQAVQVVGSDWSEMEGMNARELASMIQSIRGDDSENQAELAKFMAKPFRLRERTIRYIVVAPMPGREGYLTSIGYRNPANAAVPYNRLPAAFRAEVERFLRSGG